MSSVLRTQFIAGHRIEDLSNGNVLVDGVTELVPPSDWQPPDTTWTMHDANGNLIVGCLHDHHEPVLIERDPTADEAQAKLAEEMAALQRSGMDPRAALQLARERWPRHSRVYCGF